MNRGFEELPIITLPEKRESLLIVNSCFPIELRDGSLFVRDGISSYSVGIAQELKAGYEVTVISPGAGSSFDHEGVRFISRGGQSRVATLVGNLEYWREVLRYLLVHEIDLIISHSATTLFLSFITNVLSARCIGIIHDTHPGENGPLFNFWRDLWLRRSRGLDLVFTDNLTDRQRLLEKYGFPPQKVHCTGGGTDPLRYGFSATKEDRLIFVGRFVRSKNIGPLVESLPALRREAGNVKLALIGSGILRDEIESLVARSGLDHQVEVRSGLNDQQKIAELQRSKIYISLSQVEGFGMPVVEAMACGAVPVVSDIPAHRFIFQGRKVGFLVKDAKELTSKTAFLLREDAVWLEMAEQARRLVEEMWTWKKVKEHYEGAISTVPEKRLSGFALKIKKPLKVGILKLLIFLSYRLLVELSLLKTRNDGR
ncbi:MAG: glycosyltransferase family 4 protein [Acidobacteriota bacterium]